MAEAKKDNLYDAPFADEANKGWKHLAKYCLDHYETVKKSAYRNKKLDEIDAAVKVYNQEDKPTSDPWAGASNITLPLTTISLDNLEPRLVSGLVGKKPYVAVEMPQDQKKGDVEELIEAWFNNELEDVVGVNQMARSFVHRVMQDGTVYPLPSYDIDEQVRTDFVFEEDFPEMVKDELEEAAEYALGIELGKYQFSNGILMDLEKAEPLTRDISESLFEGGRCQLIPFHDVFIMDDVDDWEKACVVRKVRPTYSELINDSKNKKGYINVGPWLYDAATRDRLGAEDVSPTQQFEGVAEHGKKTIECIECSLSYIYNEDDTEEKDNTNTEEERIVVQIALDSKVIVRIVRLREIYHKNQHLLKRMRMFKEEGKSYGTGWAAKLSAIQKGASKTFNMAINIAEITMIPWFFFTEKTGMKARYKDGLKLQIGKGFPIDDVTGLYFPKFSINPDQMFNWINLWVSFWEKLVSIGNNQIGLNNDKTTTATESLAVIQEGNIKHNYQSTGIKDDFLEVLRCIYDLYYQHMPYDKTFNWNGEDVAVPRANMRRIKKFRLTGSTEQSNKLIERSEKESFYEKSAGDPNINPVKRAEELVKAYGHQDTGEWINPAIGSIVEKIMTIPGADQAVSELLAGIEQQLMQEQQVNKAVAA
jgi:hypothetical protein